MLCKICNSPTSNNSNTCSVQHGMAYRYLKKFDLTQPEMLKICNIETNFSIKIKHILWKTGFTSEPVCTCGNKLTYKKLLHGTLLCSPDCKKKDSKNKQKICIICSNDECSPVHSQKCISTKRELRKTNLNVNDYVIFLRKKYSAISAISAFSDVLHLNRLNNNGLISNPVCAYCEKEHQNHKNQVFNKTCSYACYASSKSGMTHSELLVYYINKGFTEEYLNTFDMHHIAKCYNNKSIKETYCKKCKAMRFGKCCDYDEKWTNIELIEEHYIREHFINNGLFDLKSMIQFYNCSETTARRMKRRMNINEKCKYSIETDIIDELQSLNNIELEHNDRTLIKPKEIDILSREHKFGIEYDGLMWHSIGKHKSRLFNNFNNEESIKYKHLNKTELLESKGYQLFHIFENEWKNENTRSIWKSIIDAKIKQTESVYDNCHIKELHKNLCDTFLEHNDLLGTHDSDIRLGLFKDQELIQVMTFNRSERFGQSEQFELTRLCNKQYHIVNANTLFSYFKEEYKPNKITCSVNRRWDNGDILERIGFVFIKNIPSEHYYFNDTLDNIDAVELIPSKLFASGSALRENSQEFRKIYDCGKKLYIYNELMN